LVEKKKHYIELEGCLLIPLLTVTKVVVLFVGTMSLPLPHGTNEVGLLYGWWECYDEKRRIVVSKKTHQKAKTKARLVVR